MPTFRIESVQVSEQFRGRWIARGGVRLEAPGDDARGIWRNVRDDGLQRRRSGLQPRQQIREPARPGRERTAPGEELVKNQAKGINIGTLICRLSLRLFRREVLEGAKNRPGERMDRCRRGGARDAEIGQQGAAVGGDHDVSRLEITVNHACRVRRRQPGRDLPRHGQDLPHRHPAFVSKDRGEIRALNELHGEVQHLRDLAEIVDPHHAGVRHLPRQLELALEAILQVPHLEGGDTAQPNQFERDRDSEGLVPGLVHHRHTARPEHLDDRVAIREPLAGPQQAGARHAAARRRM